MNARKFFYSFGKALYHVDSFYDAFARQSNIAPARLWVLYALNDGAPHTQIEICTEWELPKTTVNTAVKELERQGYATLIPIRGKRREMVIELTEEGKGYADSVLADLYKKEKAVFGDLTEEERSVTEILEKISHMLKGENA